MVSDTYFGELSEERKNKWDNDNHNPYKVLKTSNRVSGGGWDILHAANKYFNNKLQIDWGSFAWKCTKSELKRFLQDKHFEIDGIKNVDILSDDKEYGIVFIEQY